MYINKQINLYPGHSEKSRKLLDKYARDCTPSRSKLKTKASLNNIQSLHLSRRYNFLIHSM